MAKKSGVMFVEDVYGDWLPNFFSVNDCKLLCTEVSGFDFDDSESDDDFVS